MQLVAIGTQPQARTPVKFCISTVYDRAPTCLSSMKGHPKAICVRVSTTNGGQGLLGDDMNSFISIDSKSIFVEKQVMVMDSRRDDLSFPHAGRDVLFSVGSRSRGGHLVRHLCRANGGGFSVVHDNGRTCKGYNDDLLCVMSVCVV